MMSRLSRCDSLFVAMVLQKVVGADINRVFEIKIIINNMC